jgi:hypothetical protein
MARYRVSCTTLVNGEILWFLYLVNGEISSSLYSRIWRDIVVLVSRKWRDIVFPVLLVTNCEILCFLYMSCKGRNTFPVFASSLVLINDFQLLRIYNVIDR